MRHCVPMASIGELAEALMPGLRRLVAEAPPRDYERAFRYVAIAGGHVMLGPAPVWSIYVDAALEGCAAMPEIVTAADALAAELPTDFIADDGITRVPGSAGLKVF